MKKLYLYFLCLMPGALWGECNLESVTYSCAAGYYLDGDSCRPCPPMDNMNGTSLDKNAAGITACYIPMDSSGADVSGDYTLVDDCAYAN